VKLTVMTWNIHRCFGIDRKFRPNRIIEVIRHHDPDVLLLQEVDRGVPRSHKLWLDHELARECGFPYHTWAQAHVLKIGSYGNATLSKFPIRKRRVIDLRLGWRKRRNCLYTRLMPPRFSHGFHLFNWHLGLSAQERASQVEKVLHSGTLRDLTAESPILLGGDCNDWRNVLFPTAGIRDAGFHAWSEHGRRRHIRTYPSNAPIGSLDKVFWRGKLHGEHIHASKMKLAKKASDHLPLIAEFQLG
jgi:endonuclease/exonuclease/phosphatase family metal-dependent hydrolase